MPASFGMIAALQGDLDTSDGVGKVFFREDTSPVVLRDAADHINRAFPEHDEVNPSHALVVTWVDVAPHRTESRGDGPDHGGRVSLSVFIFMRFVINISKSLVKLLFLGTVQLLT